MTIYIYIYRERERDVYNIGNTKTIKIVLYIYIYIHTYTLYAQRTARGRALLELHGTHGGEPGSFRRKGWAGGLDL